MSKKTVISIVENMLMILLLFAMIVQCVGYIRLVQNGTDGILPEFPESEAKLLASGSLDISETGKSHVTPYFTGVILDDGRMYGGAYDDVLAYEVFGYFARVLENASGGTAKKIVYSGEDKKYEYLENLYNGTKNCYYVSLKNGLEFSVLCQLMTDTYTEIPENPEFIVKDMFLLCGSSGEASITAVDSDGNVMKIYPSKNIPFNKEYLESYNNTEENEFEFVNVEKNANAGKNCYFPSFKYSVKYRTIQKTPFDTYFSFNSEDADIPDFVNIFGMNGDNTRFYKRTLDGAMICVENTTSFEISQNGSFIFLPGDDDGDIGVYLEYGSDSDYGFFEYVQAAQGIASALNEKLNGSAALLSLEDIIYNNGECIFYYGYTVNGVPVERHGGYALELVFSKDRLVRSNGNIEIYLSGEDSVTDMPQKTAFVLMDNEQDIVHYFGPEFTFNNETDYETAVMRWKVEYKAADGGTQG